MKCILRIEKRREKQNGIKFKYPKNVHNRGVDRVTVINIVNLKNSLYGRRKIEMGLTSF